MEPKRLIEAALFMSGRELSIPELKKLTGIASAGHIRDMLGELEREYAQKGSAIGVFEGDNAFLMRIRDDYVSHVRQFAQDATLSKSALRTLSYVARHNGILKSEVVRRIGTAVYADVKELSENGFVLQRRYGRSSKLFLTDKFRAYFERGASPGPGPGQQAAQEAGGDSHESSSGDSGGDDSREPSGDSGGDANNAGQEEPQKTSLDSVELSKVMEEEEESFED